MDALELPREDHHEVLAMLEELERRPAENNADRKRLVTERASTSTTRKPWSGPRCAGC